MMQTSERDAHTADVQLCASPPPRVPTPAELLQRCYDQQQQEQEQRTIIGLDNALGLVDGGSMNADDSPSAGVMQPRPVMGGDDNAVDLGWNLELSNMCVDAETDGALDFELDLDLDMDDAEQAALFETLVNANPHGSVSDAAAGPGGPQEQVLQQAQQQPHQHQQRLATTVAA